MTIKQEKLAKAIVENMKSDKPLNKTELLVSAGYDETTAKATPGRTIEQKGVQEALLAYGFDEDSAKKVVTEILGNPLVKPRDRLTAADMVFKVRGTYAPEKTMNLNVTASTALSPEQVAKINQIALDDE